MQVLVSGATGFIGAYTVKALHDAGHRVRATVRSETSKERAFEGLESIGLAEARERVELVVATLDGRRRVGGGHARGGVPASRGEPRPRGTTAGQDGGHPPRARRCAAGAEGRPRSGRGPRGAHELRRGRRRRAQEGGQEALRCRGLDRPQPTGAQPLRREQDHRRACCPRLRQGPAARSSSP